MPPPSTVKDIAPPRATNEIAARGFASGAFRFGAISIVTHMLLRAYHPVYRGLTIQFKLFLQLSAMTMGGWIFAEKSVAAYNDEIRRRRGVEERRRRAWREYEEMRERYQSEMVEEAGEGGGEEK